MYTSVLLDGNVNLHIRIFCSYRVWGHACHAATRELDHFVIMKVKWYI